ncbi:MAG: biotin--[acetyl-CoA-carboxylase] ligase [Thermoanaerobaculia bacterium]
MDVPTFLEQLGADLPGPLNRVIVDRVDSTNRLARRVVATYATDDVAVPAFTVLALEQTAGRGRLDRSWTSPRGRGVYGTRVVPLPEGGEAPAERALQSLPLLSGVGLARALGHLLARGASEAATTRCTLKWPNDLLVGGRKVGGLLAESLAPGGAPPVALVGFGVNLLRPSRGPELPAGATSVADHVPAAPALGQLARLLLQGLEAELAHLGELAYAVDAYRRLSAHRPGDRVRCRVGDRVVDGELLGFSPEGFLRLAQEGQELVVGAGEIVEEWVPEWHGRPAGAEEP